jgi:ketosteroid isomerase-like protein
MPRTDVSVIESVADALFLAIEHSDTEAIEALFDTDIAVWHAGDRRDNDRSRALRVITWFIDNSTERRYEIFDRQFFETGFVQQHILHATGTNGAVMSLRVCIVIKVGENGLISRIDEYFDPADMTAFVDLTRP